MPGGGVLWTLGDLFLLQHLLCLWVQQLLRRCLSTLGRSLELLPFALMLQSPKEIHESGGVTWRQCIFHITKAFFCIFFICWLIFVWGLYPTVHPEISLVVFWGPFGMLRIQFRLAMSRQIFYLLYYCFSLRRVFYRSLFRVGCFLQTPLSFSDRNPLGKSEAKWVVWIWGMWSCDSSRSYWDLIICSL